MMHKAQFCTANHQETAAAGRIFLKVHVYCYGNKVKY